MDIDELLREINRKTKQRKAQNKLLPVRSYKEEWVIIRKNWIYSLGELDDYKLTSRVLFALLPRLSSKKYKKVYIDEIREEIGAKRNAVERALKTLTEKEVLQNEAVEHEGECRPKYYRFNPGYENIDEDDFLDKLIENDEDD